ncbi:ABC transporter permease subunit [Actinomadura chibensis]|uniref:ABC transporter permease subunit n=1 Tax=Actinomadura chibensis TaxID=392828 RepID=A0A5D0NGU8_9ACTN|nr:ABC transporter permease subunit [Actinomadura chibensis]
MRHSDGRDDHQAGPRPVHGRLRPLFRRHAVAHGEERQRHKVAGRRQGQEAQARLAGEHHGRGLRPRQGLRPALVRQLQRRAGRAAHRPGGRDRPGRPGRARLAQGPRELRVRARRQPEHRRAVRDVDAQGPQPRAGQAHQPGDRAGQGGRLVQADLREVDRSAAAGRGRRLVTAEAGPVGAGRLSRRRRRQVSLGGQYALFAVVVVLVVAFADWGKLRLNFANWDVAKGLFPEIITVGLRNTALYTAVGFGIGLAGGLVVALMRLSSVPPYRWFATVYIEVFRGLPLLLIFIFVGVGVPLAFPGTNVPGGAAGQAGLALGLAATAYLAETIRAGIEAVPTGQMEAARSLGMSYPTAMRSIVIPQAFRIVIPPLTNQLVLLCKDSSLVLFLGITLEQRELTKFGRDLAGDEGNTTPIIVAGICYLLITIPLSLLARRLEARRK